MNLRDRYLNALKGEKVDRVPLMLDGFRSYTTKVDIDSNPDHGWREIAHRVYDKCAYHLRCQSYIGTGSNQRYFALPHQFMKVVNRKQTGNSVETIVKIDTPKGKLTAVTIEDLVSKTEWTIKYPVESLDDIHKIMSIPWELPQKLSPFDLSSAPNNFYEKGIVNTWITSPCVCVSGMMKYEYYLELCHTEFALIKELTDECTDRVLKILDVLLSNNAIDYVWIGGSEWLTPPMASPKLYDALVQNQERRLIERIHQGETLCHIHCHGNIRAVLEKMIERGGDFTEPVEPPPDGDITFSAAKEIVAGRMTLGGNIEQRIMEIGSVEEVEEATRKAFEGGKYRMVLKTSAAPICKFTPPVVQNYHRLIDVWEELSFIV